MLFFGSCARCGNIGPPVPDTCGWREVSDGCGPIVGPLDSIYLGISLRVVLRCHTLVAQSHSGKVVVPRSVYSIALTVFSWLTSNLGIYKLDWANVENSCKKEVE